MKSLALILIVVMIWVVGLLAFASRIARSTPPPDPAPADAIVTLTGPSTTRIAAAMKLLEDGEAPYLLVSGVNRMASRADIQAISKAPKGLYDCCVTLGRNAPNTIGNARETAAWARAHGFQRLIVVTADYHMPPRDPGAARRPAGGGAGALSGGHRGAGRPRWWRSGQGLRRMLLEYSKYLVILGREAVLSLGPRERPPRGAGRGGVGRGRRAVNPVHKVLFLIWLYGSTVVLGLVGAPFLWARARTSWSWCGSGRGRWPGASRLSRASASRRGGWSACPPARP